MSVRYSDHERKILADTAKGIPTWNTVIGHNTLGLDWSFPVGLMSSLFSIPNEIEVFILDLIINSTVCTHFSTKKYTTISSGI